MASAGPEAQTLARLYENRFSGEARRSKDQLWHVLVERFLQRFIPPNAVIVDVAGGFGEFAGHVQAARKIVVDLNPDAAVGNRRDIEFRSGDALRLHEQTDLLGIADVAFVSNFFEHLASSSELLAVLAGIHALLKPSGSLLVIQPNFRYAYREYYDFLDHSLPITDRSLSEALKASGFEVDELIPQFLPFTTKGRPSSPALLRVYLGLPLLWRFFGAQMFVRAHPAANA
ncbi:MAG: Methyltransferase type 12 [Candidatus Eremiobacteraeota bacterium]|nr:Methyltransferase type 12 [Candidatus Eremiobacteraeota bacterium]